MSFRRFFSEATMKAKTIIYHKKFQGVPTPANFKLVEEELPTLKKGEFLVEAEFISVDPYMRVFNFPVGKTMSGDQVGKVIDSKNSKYPVGEFVVGEFGWRTHTVTSGAPGPFFHLEPRILRDYSNLPRSLALGVLGMPGNAAHFGLELAKPGPGNTVLVSGAAGAVGLTVGQIAKIKGCTVVGITGSDQKGQKLVKDAGFDSFVNYNCQDFEAKLAKTTPDLIDVYFDNVGGEISSAVLNRMNRFGKVIICGAISTYNEENPKAREVQTPVKTKHLEMQGINVMRWRDQWEVGIGQNKKWIEEGLLKYFETVVEGFEEAPEAFMGLFRGDNFGKTVVRVK